MNAIKIITVILSLLVTCMGLTSQIRKNIIRRNMEGLSLTYFLLLAISYSFWTIYGLLQKDIVLIIPMGMGMIASWIVVIQFYLFRINKNNKLNS